MLFDLSIITNKDDMNTSNTPQSLNAYPFNVAATVRSPAEFSSGYKLDATAKSSASPSRQLTDAATPSTHQSATDAIEVARASIVRDFSALIEQQPRLL